MVIGCDIGYDISLHNLIRITLQSILQYNPNCKILLIEEIRWKDIYTWYFDEITSSTSTSSNELPSCYYSMIKACKECDEEDISDVNNNNDCKESNERNVNSFVTTSNHIVVKNIINLKDEYIMHNKNVTSRHSNDDMTSLDNSLNLISSSNIVCSDTSSLDVGVIHDQYVVEVDSVDNRSNVLLTKCNVLLHECYYSEGKIE
jgi:hypothetical protein